MEAVQEQEEEGDLEEWEEGEWGEEEPTEELKEEEEKKEEVQVDKEGCKHYRRKCQKQCPECLEFFTCRLCHNEEKFERAKDIKKAHELDRHKVSTIRCLQCLLPQKPQQACEGCAVQFAVYFCAVCNLFDNDAIQKGIFHCEKCGICRVGGRNNFFHCDTCNACLSLAMEGSHKCKKELFKEDCPVCLEDMHTSRKAGIIMRCGHPIHSSCF